MKQRWLKPLALGLTLVLSLSIISFVAAAPGDLDITFGSGGIAITDLNNNLDAANAVVVQADGSIVTAGSTTGAVSNFMLTRYTSTGNPDITFGTNGSVITAVGAGNDVINALALQPDGNVVVAGSSTVGAKTVFALARYISTTGALDASFGTSGIVTTSLSLGNDAANGIALQNDGKIVVGGVADAAFAVARYTSTGALDSSFHGTGIVTTTAGAADIGHAVAIQPTDGKIVLAGESDQGGVNAFTTLRYNTNGSLDNTFNFSGIATAKFGSQNTFALAVALQPADGKIVIAGYTNSVASDFALARYNTNGSLDTTFGATGLISTTFGADVDEAHALLVQPTGKIIAVGFSRQGTQHNNFALARYLTNGSLDNGFGAGGLVLTNLQTNGGLGSDDQALTAALQPDNNIIVAGTSDNGTATAFDIAVARYLSPSQPPVVASFARSGLENSTVTFTTTDFTANFSSPENNLLSQIKITALPLTGTLRLGTVPIVNGQEIPIAQLGALTYTPSTYFFGTDTFNWNGFDGINYAVADATVTLSIQFVNQPPSFTKGPNQSARVGSNAQTVAGWATNINPGPPNEVGQVVTFTLTTSNDALFSALPALNATTGDLTYTPAAQLWGTATVTATLTDSGGTANGGVNTSAPQTFTIQIDPYRIYLPFIRR